MPLLVDDTGSLTIHELRAKARRINSRKPLSLIVVDYLQLLSGSDSRTPREQQIAEISRGLKAMAKELNLPVLVLSQLNRDSEKERRPPRLSDLRESGSIEQDADVVLLLGRLRNDSLRGEDDSDATGENELDGEPFEPIRLHLAKQRNGPTGRLDLAFRSRYTLFVNYRSGSLN